MALTNIERETIINFNAAEDTAEIYTADPVYIRKLDKLCEQFPDTYKFMAELSAKRCKESKTYSMPKRLVKFRSPVTREISEEQREALAERLRKAREAKNIYLSSCDYKTTVSESMEWCQVVKLPSATIPCFFRLLFIERKRQGLILSRIRLDRVAFGLIWLRLSA